MANLEQKFPQVPTADSAANVTIADIVGNKTDTVGGDSVVALIKILDAGIGGDVTTALEAENLDHLLTLDGATQKYPEQCATDSIVAKLIAKNDPAVPNTYDCTTDSQEAISDKVGAFSGDGGSHSRIWLF